MIDIEFGIWKHKRTGNEYELLFVATSDIDKSHSVFYQSLSDGKVWQLALDDFLAKFEKVAND